MKTKPSIYLRWQGYYDYTKENVEKYVLKEPRLIGVYKIAELQTFGNLVPFYVGEDENLYQALIAYFDEIDINECIKNELDEKICCFKFAHLLDKQERENVVYTLCEHYRPLCNTQQKTWKDSLVNVNFH